MIQLFITLVSPHYFFFDSGTKTGPNFLVMNQNTRFKNLEPIIQSEVSQKEKDKYHILMHIYGIEKDGINDPICKAAKET